MAKLYLRFEQSLLKVFPLPEGQTTIGRTPDNVVQVDNPAVSGHHARIYYETDHYVLEDCNSRNGTFVNGQPVTRVVLNDDDEILICKHTLIFKEEKEKVIPQTAKPAAVAAPVPQLDATMLLDTRRVKEMLGQKGAAVASAPAGPAASAPISAAPSPVPQNTAPWPAMPAVRERVGVLTVLSGATSQKRYVLGAKLNAIGKSDMASIKLTGWFKPKLAAVINRGEQKYFIAASVGSVQIKVNHQFVSGAHELKDGDVVEVCGVQMAFSYQ